MNEKTKSIISNVLYFAAVLLLSFLIVRFVGQRTEVIGSSMVPTLTDGDQLITDKISYRFTEPERFDIIVFPHEPDHEFYIKRVIGLPGETVEIDEDGTIYINGEVLSEEYGYGETRPQELASKAVQLPQDIEWHFIGHLQTNKLKMVLPYATLVQSVDSVHLLQAIDNWGSNNDKVISVLLELHIGAEETKQGFHEEEILEILFHAEDYKHIRFCGLMGMASHTDDQEVINADFERIDSFMAYLVDLFPELKDFNQLSIGMSDDWRIAVQHGSTMVRIGTAIFGAREY